MINENDRAAARNGMPGSSFSDGGLGYVLGANERDEFERRNKAGYSASGSSDQSLQRLIVACCVGVPSMIGYESNWLPIPAWGWWVVGIAGTFTALFILEKLPGWLSGGAMGIFLGSVAAYFGWSSGGLYWSAGAGLGTAIIMYYLFSRLE